MELHCLLHTEEVGQDLPDNRGLSMIPCLSHAGFMVTINKSNELVAIRIEKV